MYCCLTSFFPIVDTCLSCEDIVRQSWGSGPPSNTWFPGPSWVLNPNSISISAAVVAGLTSVTDRQTDHATRSVTIGRIYVHSTAMRPKNCIWIIILLNSVNILVKYSFLFFVKCLNQYDELKMYGFGVPCKLFILKAEITAYCAQLASTNPWYMCS